MLIGEGYDWTGGEEHAWGILSGLDSADVVRRAKAAYDEPTGQYILPLFNTEVFVSPEDRKIWGNSEVAEFLLSELHYLSRLTILWYLIQVQDIPLSGTLLNPGNLTGGMIFRTGSHVLPLDEVVTKYGDDIQGFLQRGMKFGGEQLDYGDASLRLFPLPRVPVAMLLWGNDEEFPARAEVLFDDNCSAHLPTDIIWSTAMISVLLMLESTL